MAKLVLEAGERLLKSGNICLLQGGGRLKFPLFSPFHVTDRRFVYRDYGKWAPFMLQAGLLILLLVRGREVSLPLAGLRLSRGSYGRNRKLLRLASTDGREVLIDNFDLTVDLLRTALGTAGIGLPQTGPEEWVIPGPGQSW